MAALKNLESKWPPVRPICVDRKNMLTCIIS